MAKVNIKNGPIIQVITNEIMSNLRLPITLVIFSNLTLVRGGYIITISPIAKGILVVPVENEFIKPDELGIKYPIATPKIMARNIHNVRYWSRKVSLFFMADIVILNYEHLLTAAATRGAARFVTRS